MFKICDWVNEAGEIISLTDKRSEILLDSRKLLGDLFLNGAEMSLKNLCGFNFPTELFNVSIQLSNRKPWRIDKYYPGVCDKNDIPNYRLNGFQDIYDYRNEDDPWGERSNSDRVSNTRDIQKKSHRNIIGEFIANRNVQDINVDTIGTILLYPRAMASTDFGKNLKNLETMFWSTLAHEVLYAFQYYQLLTHGLKTRWFGENNNRDIVIDSLAEYYEYKFLLERHQITHDSSNKEYADLKEKEWKWLDIDGRPCSGALAIKQAFQKQVYKYTYDNLFNRLFDLSLTDWKTAADILKTGYYLCGKEIKDALTKASLI